MSSVLGETIYVEVAYRDGAWRPMATHGSRESAEAAGLEILGPLDSPTQMRYAAPVALVPLRSAAEAKLTDVERELARERTAIADVVQRLKHAEERIRASAAAGAVRAEAVASDLRAAKARATWFGRGLVAAMIAIFVERMLHVVLW